MNKRALSKLQKEEATAEMMDLIKQLPETIMYICTAKTVEVDDKKILELNFYKNENLLKGSSAPIFRTFMSQDDYITQDLSVSNVKWLTAALENMYTYNTYRLWDINWEAKHYESFYTTAFRSQQDEDTVKLFLKKFERENSSTWSTVRYFQERVRKKRLVVRYKKETDQIDALMETLQPVPEDFYKWVWEEAMCFSRYLIYTTISKHKAECKCTHCNNKTIVDKRETHLKHNEKGTCPMCGSKVTYKSLGKMAGRIKDESWVMYTETTPEGFVLRYFYAYRILSKSAGDVLLNQYIDELSRSFYTFPNAETINCKNFVWDVYKKSEKVRWCPFSYWFGNISGRLYPYNLPQAWANTPLKYSAIEVFANRNLYENTINIESAINTYIRFPKLEFLIKVGLYNLANSIIRNGMGRDLLNKDGRTIFDVLKLDKLRAKILMKNDGDVDELMLLQYAKKIKLNLDAEQLKKFRKEYGIDIHLLDQTQRVSLHKILKYIDKESQRYPIAEPCSWRRMIEKEEHDNRKRNMSHDWIEYLGWCERLGYDLNNRFIYMPNNFKAVHDRTAEEYQAYIDRKTREKRERYDRIIKKMKEDKEKIPVFNMHSNGLFIRLPNDAAEIKAEGAFLHHCVGSYAEKVAKGETIILFVRKEEKPEVPYYTLEWKGNVQQCRGSHNADMTPDVEKFIRRFETKMIEYQKTMAKAE